MATVDAYIPAHLENYLQVAARKIDLVVIHDMEWAETDQTAEACAKYFARARIPASAHYCIDNNSVVRSVRDKDVAYCAPGANHNGLHLEHAGFARQTTIEWLDPYGRAMLLRSAKVTAELCKEYNIPIEFVGVSDLRAGKRGITTHAAVSKAFGRSSHTDPGFFFPLDYYISLVKTHYAALNKPWPVPLPEWWWDWAGWKLAGSPAGERPANVPAPGVAWAPGGKYYWAWIRLQAFKAARG